MAGIECEFIEKPPKAFQSECPICLLVLREPYQATCCGKSFCKECIEQLKVKNVCPTCKTDNFFSYPNKGLQQSLYSFQVYCSHKSKGCEWTGELRELDKHLNSEPPADKSLEGCSFTVINCPWSHTTGCEARLPREDVKIHMNDELLSHVMKQTALVLDLSEKNKTLNDQLQMVHTLLHSVEREKEHLKQQVFELKGEIMELKEAQDVVSHTGHPIGPVEITMTHFKQHKQDDDDWFSLPFYTHPYGYKMCMCVCPNGLGSGKGTHLGVTVHLMRGEFDDRLKWPFRGDITIKLLNQEEDKDHIGRVIHYDDNTPDEYAGRVTKGERNVQGKGFGKLLAFSDLEQGYLKNDCLKFCITKVVLR